MYFARLPHGDGMGAIETNVFGVRHDVKVIAVHAPSRPTTMVRLQFVWQWLAKPASDADPAPPFALVEVHLCIASAE